MTLTGVAPELVSPAVAAGVLALVIVTALSRPVGRDEANRRSVDAVGVPGPGSAWFRI